MFMNSDSVANDLAVHVVRFVTGGEAGHVC